MEPLSKSERQARIRVVLNVAMSLELLGFLFGCALFFDKAKHFLPNSNQNLVGMVVMVASAIGIVTIEVLKRKVK